MSFNRVIIASVLFVSSTFSMASENECSLAEPKYCTPEERDRLIDFNYYSDPEEDSPPPSKSFVEDPYNAASLSKPFLLG